MTTVLCSGKFKTSCWARWLAVFVVVSMVLSACGSESAKPALPEVEDGPEYGDSIEEWGGANGDASESDGGDVAPSGYEQFEWEDLAPPSSVEDDDSYFEELAGVEDGSAEADAIYEEMLAEADAKIEAEGQPVKTELDGKPIQLSGFVAPLTYDDEIVTEFLLVPYFGACIHVPPPPPNQTIMVTLDKDDGLTVEESWGAVWVTGTLAVTSTETDLATAGYSITGATSGVEDEF